MSKPMDFIFIKYQDIGTDLGWLFSSKRVDRQTFIAIWRIESTACFIVASSTSLLKNLLKCIPSAKVSWTTARDNRRVFIDQHADQTLWCVGALLVGIARLGSINFKCNIGSKWRNLAIVEFPLSILLGGHISGQEDASLIVQTLGWDKKITYVRDRQQLMQPLAKSTV